MRKRTSGDPKGLDLGDKEERRLKAKQMYERVLLYLGDNLRDFDDKYRIKPEDVTTPEGRAKAIASRKALAEADGDKWGAEWIILPNPMYGEWLNAVDRKKPGAGLRTWK